MDNSILAAKIQHIDLKLTEFYSLMQETLKEEQFSKLEKPLMNIGEMVVDTLDQLK